MYAGAGTASIGLIRRLINAHGPNPSLLRAGRSFTGGDSLCRASCPFITRGEVIVDLDALVTAREAMDHPGLKAQRVCRHTIAWWRAAGKLEERGKRGRSPLYRFGDVLRAERDTRLKVKHSHRSGCRTCLRETRARVAS